MPGKWIRANGFPGEILRKRPLPGHSILLPQSMPVPGAPFCSRTWPASWQPSSGSFVEPEPFSVMMPRHRDGVRTKTSSNWAKTSHELHRLGTGVSALYGRLACGQKVYRQPSAGATWARMLSMT